MDTNGNTLHTLKTVGIGTDSPNLQLHVHRPLGGETLQVSNDDTIMNFGTYKARDEAYIWVQTNDHLKFGTNNTERMRINNNGYVGIGTRNPSQILDVNGNINFTGNLYKSGSVLTLSNYSDSNTLVNDTTFVSNLYDKLHDNEINIYDTIKNGCSTVSFSIRGSNYTCSGSFITFDSSDLQYGLFMTAAHCVMEVSGTSVLTTTELYVTNPINGNYTKVDVGNIYYDGIADVAIIRTNIDFSSNSTYPLQLSSVTPQTGDICFL